MRIQPEECSPTFQSFKDCARNIGVWSVRCLIPSIYTAFGCSNWDNSTTYLNRLVFCNCIMLLIDAEDSLVAYSFARNRGTEICCALEFLLLQILIFVANLSQDAEYESLNTFEEFSFIIYFLALGLNAFSLLLIIIGLASMSVYNYIRSFQEVNAVNLARGLTPEEINKIQILEYAQLVEKYPQILAVHPKLEMTIPSPATKLEMSNNAKEGMSSIGVGKFKSAQILSSGSLSEKDKCSICLIEYDPDELIAILPKCKHYFHKDCIHLWLSSNSKCPFCRDNLILALQKK